METLTEVAKLCPLALQGLLRNRAGSWAISGKTIAAARDSEFGRL